MIGVDPQGGHHFRIIIPETPTLTLLENVGQAPKSFVHTTCVNGMQVTSFGLSSEVSLAFKAAFENVMRDTPGHEDLFIPSFLTRNNVPIQRP